MRYDRRHNTKDARGLAPTQRTPIHELISDACHHDTRECTWRFSFCPFSGYSVKLQGAQLPSGQAAISSLPALDPLPAAQLYRRSFAERGSRPKWSPARPKCRRLLWSQELPLRAFFILVFFCTRVAQHKTSQKAKPFVVRLLSPLFLFTNRAGGENQQQQHKPQKAHL